MRITAYLITVVILSLLFISCSDQAVQPEDSLDNPDNSIIGNITPADKELAGIANSFGFKIFGVINSDNHRDSNVFISPLSISLALGMTYNGAAGETRRAIGNTLGLNDMTLDEINTSFKSLMEFLTGLDPEVTFEIANSNWIREGFPVRDEFINLNQNYFNAEVAELDFSQAEAVDIINNWVDEKTHGKISEIVQPPINPMTVLFLINAIYFKGIWTYEFNPDDTEDRPFYLRDGTLIDWPTMSLKAEFNYYHEEGLQVVDLPYGGDKFSMTILLPSYQIDIDDFVDDFTEESWNRWIDGLAKDTVNLFMPKFTLEEEYKLNDVLSALGMEIAFIPEMADFSNINETAPLCISKVKHKTFVSVDEEGTEAAAVTSVEIICTSIGGPEEDIYMRINHPFVLVIRDRVSNAMLFMGKIVEPKE